MKIDQIIINEMGTVAGAISTVAKPMGETQKRSPIRGLSSVEDIISGKAKKKKPYANSLSEGKVKQLSLDLKNDKDGLSEIEFKKKYGKSKEEMRKALQSKTDIKVQEAKLDEEDIILVKGRGNRLKSGFIPRGQSRVDHEVSMARSDVLATIKNAKAIYELLRDRSEDEGIEGWVQEKLIKANDYLNSVKEYYDEKMMPEMSGGVIAAGGVGEGVAEGSEKAHGWKIGKMYRGGKEPFEVAYVDASDEKTALAKAHHILKPNHMQILTVIRRPQGVAEGAKVDRMVKHIAKSERGLGHSKKEAENIAWATLNKRGMLNNKNKKDN